MDDITVTQCVDVKLNRVIEILVDKYRMITRHLDGGRHVAPQLRKVVHQFHGPATEHIGRLNQHQPISLAMLSASSSEIAVPFIGWDRSRSLRVSELSILGQIDGVRICPENGNTRGFQCPHQLEWRLPAELDDHPLPNPWPAHCVQAR